MPNVHVTIHNISSHTPPEHTMNMSSRCVTPSQSNSAHHALALPSSSYQTVSRDRKLSAPAIKTEESRLSVPPISVVNLDPPVAYSALTPKDCAKLAAIGMAYPRIEKLLENLDTDHPDLNFREFRKVLLRQKSYMQT